MEQYEWNEEKNQWLRNNRNLCFEDVIIAIENRRILGRTKHPNRKKYANQKILIIEINNYAYYVPYVIKKKIIFFKTIIPSRKLTKLYQL